MPTITKFRATSGSQTVYFDSNENQPTGIVNKVAVSETFTPTGLVLTGSDVLWAWNGEDTSQFDLGVTWTGSAANVALSVESDPSRISPTGNMLVISSSANSEVVWYASESLGTNRFVVEYYTSGSTNGFGGVSFLCDGSGSNFHGFGYCESNGGNGFNLKVENAVLDTSNDQTGGASNPNFVQIEVLCHDRSTVSGSPSFRWWADSHNRTDSISSQRATEILAGGANWANTTYASSWDNLQLRRFGLMFRGLPGVFKIYTMIIRKHPLDR